MQKIKEYISEKLHVKKGMTPDLMFIYKPGDIVLHVIYRNNENDCLVFLKKILDVEETKNDYIVTLTPTPLGYNVHKSYLSFDKNKCNNYFTGVSFVDEPFLIYSQDASREIINKFKKNNTTITGKDFNNSEVPNEEINLSDIVSVEYLIKEFEDEIH